MRNNSLFVAEEYYCTHFGAEEFFSHFFMQRNILVHFLELRNSLLHRSTVVCRGLVPTQYIMGTAYLFCGKSSFLQKMNFFIEKEEKIPRFIEGISPHIANPLLPLTSRKNKLQNIATETFPGMMSQVAFTARNRQCILVNLQCQKMLCVFISLYTM